MSIELIRNLQAIHFAIGELLKAPSECGIEKVEQAMAVALIRSAAPACLMTLIELIDRAEDFSADAVLLRELAEALTKTADELEGTTCAA